jgi:hypothetical protein
MGCGHWFDKKLRACDECGCPIGAHNPSMYRSMLDRQLFATAEHAHKEQKIEAAFRSGREPDPPRWARQAAKQIVADW